MLRHYTFMQEPIRCIYSYFRCDFTLTPFWYPTSITWPSDYNNVLNNTLHLGENVHCSVLSI